MWRNSSIILATLLLVACDGVSVGNRTQRSSDRDVAMANSAGNVSEPLEGVGAPMAWRVVQGSAYYGSAGQPPAFALHCDQSSRSIVFERQGGGTTLVLSAGGSEVGLGTRQVEGGRVQARTGMGDAVLDAMSRSRAQISVGGGAEVLTIPGGVAVRRVVDFCRAPPTPEPEPTPEPSLGNIVIPPVITEPAPSPATTPPSR